ncbi:MAG: AraC family transcriptional regulator [Herbinix sp.]|jgi:AraC-like DNA-binding protein|nr:AraC family transcriptional regulator [Herbinix sp.]
MKPAQYYINEDLICIDNGYKPPNLHKWGPGERDIYALHYVINGKGYFKSNNVTYTLCAGESFIIFPHMEVNYYPDSQNPWEYIWIDFKGDEAIHLLSMTELTYHTPVVGVSPENLEPLFQSIVVEGHKPFEKERSIAKLRLLLSYYMEYYPKADTIPKADYVVSAKEFIENNYWKSTLTVSDIADFVKIERTYLFRLFKEATGMSIITYLTSFRIRRACTLLKSSELSIKAVACSVGYEDQLYFSKVFKKVTSYTPSEYSRKKKHLSGLLDKVR